MHQFFSIMGSGFVAKNFKKILPFLKKNNILLYAAGVSNSKTKNKFALKKELKKIKQYKKYDNNRTIVYISTCSIKDSTRNKSLYVKNKIKIEKYIKKRFKKFIILRFPELVGKSKNPNTLINFFYNNIKNKKKFFILKNAKRNILDIEDAVNISKNILNDRKNLNKTISIFNKFYSTPLDIVRNIEKILNTEANYTLVKQKKSTWSLDYKIISKEVRKSKVTFSKKYLYNILKKYY